MVDEADDDCFAVSNGGMKKINLLFLGDPFSRKFFRFFDKS
jgi:hypothetical protein